MARLDRWGSVALVAFAIPGSVLLLVALGWFEVRRRARRGTRGPMLSETYVNEFTALFYGTKRAELDHRDSWSMMRDEQHQAAPPTDVDLDRGTAVLRRENPR